MAGTIRIREVQDNDRETILRIFNHYAKTGFAAYPEGPVPGQFFAHLRDGTFSFYVLEGDVGVVGFGLMKPFLPFPTFNKSWVITSFILPEYTRMGLGTRLLEHFIRDAKVLGLRTLIANMFSKNEPGIQFHRQHGFEEVGRLHDTGTKFGEPFDVIWMQRAL